MVMVNGEIDGRPGDSLLAAPVVPDLGLELAARGDFERSRRLRRLTPGLPRALQKTIQRAVRRQQRAGRDLVEAEADVYRALQLIVAAAQREAAESGGAI